MTGFVQGVLTYALRDDFAPLEQFLAFFFGRFEELIGLLSQQFILPTSARKKHTNEYAESGKTDPYCQRILLHRVFQLLCARGVSAFYAAPDFARGRPALFIH